MSFFRWLKGEEPSIIKKINFMIRHKFDKGAYGEYLTEYLLRKRNLKGYGKTLHNIYIPYRGGTSEIDILLVHEKGIFVFESKNYSGWIYGSDNQVNWTQVLNRNAKNRFYNPIKQNATHVKALSKYLGIDSGLMKSYIVFSERCELKKVPHNTKEYTILQRHYLLKTIKKDIAKRKAIFTPQEVDIIIEKLTPLTKVSKKVKRAHVDNINAKINRKRR